MGVGIFFTIWTGISLARRSYLYFYKKPDSKGRPVRGLSVIALAIVWLLYAAVLGTMSK